ncbi:MAG TPA: hypothetical protein VF712_13900 [Thermoleophilaceae bacterium]
MDADEARSRLGLDDDASPQAVLRAHHAAASAAVRLPRDARADVLTGLDDARDTLLGVSRSKNATVLEQLSTPRGMAGLTAAGVAVAALPLMTDVSAGVLSVLALALLGLGLALSVRRRSAVATVVLALVLVVSAGVTLRAATDPGTQEFLYDGNFLNEAPANSPFAGEVGIPLTTDPSTGTVAETLVDERTTFVVSCVRTGAFKHRRPRVLWAYIAGGDYKTFWIPVSYLAGLRPGAARTLLSCSNWRWRLHNLAGGP